MGRTSLGLATIAIVCTALPNPGMFVGLGLAVFACVAGWLAYRRRDDPSPARLAGAGGLFISVLALSLNGAKFGLTMAALSRLESLFS